MRSVLHTIRPPHVPSVGHPNSVKQVHRPCNAVQVGLSQLLRFVCRMPDQAAVAANMASMQWSERDKNRQYPFLHRPFVAHFLLAYAPFPPALKTVPTTVRFEAGFKA